MKIVLLQGFLAACALSLVAAGAARAASDPVRALPGGVAHAVQSDLLAVPFAVAPSEEVVRSAAATCVVGMSTRASDSKSWQVEGCGVWIAPARKDTHAWPPNISAAATVFLRLSRPLPPGHAATVSCPGAGLELEIAWKPHGPSSAVQVNQLGFAADDPHKRAFYHAWAGTLGDLTRTEAPAFRVLNTAGFDAAGKPLVVHEGVGRRAESESAGGLVWVLDFGAVRAAGDFVVEVAGVGRSAPFPIGDHRTSAPLRMLRTAFYHQRCGAELAPGDGVRPRPACHLDGGCFHPGLAETPLYAGEPIDSCRPISGGWHDASDYGRYVAPATVALWYGLVALEEFGPSRPADVAIGPGAPADWAAELRWELDWLAQMQGPGGGVYHKLTSARYGTDRLPHLDQERQDFAEMTTHATARTAAVMARAARVFATSEPLRARHYREVAARAWQFLRAHPDTTPSPGFKNREWNGGGDYADRFGDADERAWAAAEWMALEGKSTPDMERWIAGAVPEPRNPHVPPLRVHDWPPPFEDAWRFALWTYGRKGHPGADSELRQAIRESWTARADSLTEDSARDAYGSSYAPKPTDGFGFGQMNGARWALDLMLAERLLDSLPNERRARWRQAARDNLAVLFGANPLGWSWFTGVGARHPTSIEYRIDHLDGSTTLLPGHPVDGPASGLHSSARAAEALFVPPIDDIPAGFRYADIHDPILNEPTVREMSEVFFVLMAL